MKELEANSESLQWFCRHQFQQNSLQTRKKKSSSSELIFLWWNLSSSPVRCAISEKKKNRSWSNSGIILEHSNPVRMFSNILMLAYDKPIYGKAPINCRVSCNLQNQQYSQSNLLSSAWIHIYIPRGFMIKKRKGEEPKLVMELIVSTYRE